MKITATILTPTQRANVLQDILSLQLQVRSADVLSLGIDHKARVFFDFVGHDMARSEAIHWIESMPLVQEVLDVEGVQ